MIAVDIIRDQSRCSLHTLKNSIKMLIKSMLLHLILAGLSPPLLATASPILPRDTPSYPNCIQLEGNTRSAQDQELYLYMSVYDAGLLVCDFAGVSAMSTRRECIPGYSIEINVNSTSDPMHVNYTTPKGTLHLQTEKPICENVQLCCRRRLR